MLNPADFGLTDNPFGMVPNPAIDGRWAGLPLTKNALADVIASVRPDDVGASEFVVLSGDYGAGKSHALRYFTRFVNDEEKSGYAIYMSEVMVGAGLSFSALCPRILQQLTDKAKQSLVNKIKDAVNNSVEQMEAESSFQITSDLAIESKVLQKQDQDHIKSLYNNGQILSLEGKDDYTSAKMLASLFRVMTSSIGGSPPPFDAVYLFLDEVESTIEQAKAAQQIAFFSALRSLINEVTEHFALILSFTTQTAILEATVPQALQERMTRPYIQCEQLDSNGARRFVQEFLEFVRPQNSFVPPQPFYPFSEAAINTIFEREPTLLPRRILYLLRRVWERAARYENLQPGEEISSEMADEILKGVI